MNAIQIKDPNQIGNLLNAVADECIWARTIFRQRVCLQDDLSKHQKVFEEAKNFWALTLYAYADFLMARLCRIYDQTQFPDSLSLQSLLLTIKETPEVFDEAHFRDRNKDDPNIDALLWNAGQLDHAQLDKDIADTSKSDSLVSKLWQVRIKAFAHTDSRQIIEVIPPNGGLSFGDDDAEDLVERACDIVSRYHLNYYGSIMAGVRDGIGDYMPMLTKLDALVKQGNAQTGT